MKIVTNNSRLIPFKDISCGEVFKDHSGFYCMKTKGFVTVNGESYIDWVRLTDGMLGFTKDDEVFEKVECKLVVSN